MIASIRTSNLLVLDEFLGPELLREVWKRVETESYFPQHVLGQWSRLWRTQGTLPASTQNWKISEIPEADDYRCVLGNAFFQIAERCPELCKPGWGDLSLHMHVLHAGTKIGWHVDGHSYGSFAYYPHPAWDANWGGEMMIPDIARQEKPEHSLSNDWDNKHVLGRGVGYSIMPKPDRLVFTAPGVVHSIARVDADAGMNRRFSVVGFLVEKSP